MTATRSARRRALAIVAAAAAIAALAGGCRGVLGLHDPIEIGTDAGDAATGDAGPTCPQGQTLCADSCTLLENDLRNCGECGHDCGFASCQGGMCAVTATLLTSVTALRPNPRGGIYALDGYGIFTWQPSANKKDYVVGSLDAGVYRNITNFAVSPTGDFVYTTKDDELWVRRASGPRLVGSVPSTWLLAADSTYAYYAPTYAQNRSAIMRVPFDGSGPPTEFVPILGGDTLCDLIATDGALYWNAAAGTAVVGADGGTPAYYGGISTGEASLAADGQSLFSTKYEGQSGDQEIVRIDLATFSVTPLIKVTPVNRLAVSATHVYVGGTGILRVPRGVGTTLVLATLPLVSGDCHLNTLALDSSNAYFLSGAAPWAEVFFVAK